MLKTLFFDFGGCLDAPGIHSRTLFWDAYVEAGLGVAVGREIFQEAYTGADQRMMASGEAKEMGLREFNRWNCTLISTTLGLDLERSQGAGDIVTERMAGYLAKSRAALEPLRGHYHLGIISNFTGNLEVIMREYQIRDFFQSVTESYYAGSSKPDLPIFRLAMSRQPNAPEECLYIGDNPVNDIAPALALGLKTALIHPRGKRKECGAHAYLEDLADLPSVIQKI